MQVTPPSGQQPPYVPPTDGQEPVAAAADLNQNKVQLAAGLKELQAQLKDYQIRNPTGDDAIKVLPACHEVAEAVAAYETSLDAHSGDMDDKKMQEQRHVLEMVSDILDGKTSLPLQDLKDVQDKVNKKLGSE